MTYRDRVRLLAPLLLLPLLAAPPDALDLQAEGVARRLAAGTSQADFTTGSTLFDREWDFGTWQMAALGFAGHAATHPAARATDLSRMEQCLERLLSEAGRRFDLGMWGRDPLADLDAARGHMAWLGYTNLALSAHRWFVPGGRFAGANDALSLAIARRLAHEPAPETYPGERYPVDVAAGVASLDLRARALGLPPLEQTTRWKARMQSQWLVEGVLVQSVDARGRPSDEPRGSGSFLAAWFLGWGDPEAGAALYRSARDALYVPMGPVAAMREYRRGVTGKVDVDSGPVVAGLGVSATGFAIGAALAARDLDTALRLSSTATLFGVPVDADGARHWSSGAALGGAPLADAILFAMMATPPGGLSRPASGAPAPPR